MRPGQETAMLSDAARLADGPAPLAAMLAELGYDVEAGRHGIVARGQVQLPWSLLFPLHHGAGPVTVRGRALAGAEADRVGTIAAGLSAVRAGAARPTLLFLADPQPGVDGIDPARVISLEGGVVPRIWPGCFGSFDALVRVVGRAAHPGLASTAVNAIEAAGPVLAALLALKASLQERGEGLAQQDDAPLRPRLTVAAAHGGLRGSLLPVVFDILVNRRYAPCEVFEAALAEIGDAVRPAAAAGTRVTVEIDTHAPPCPDPALDRRSWVEKLLVQGWGWPQMPFSAARLLPGAVLLGGLEQPASAGGGGGAIPLDRVVALERTLRALLDQGGGPLRSG